MLSGWDGEAGPTGQGRVREEKVCSTLKYGQFTIPGHPPPPFSCSLWLPPSQDSRRERQTISFALTWSLDVAERSWRCCVFSVLNRISWSQRRAFGQIRRVWLNTGYLQTSGKVAWEDTENVVLWKCALLAISPPPLRKRSLSLGKLNWC